MEADADDIIFRPAWRLDDSQIVEDVRRMWSQIGLRPRIIDKRVTELCATAYSGDKLVAVSTAYIFDDRYMRNKFFGYRCMTIPEFRQHNLAWRITAYSRKILQDWTAHNPEQRILGLLIDVETDKYEEGLLHPVREGFGMTLHFVGYTPEGNQLRAIWFDNAKLDDRAVKREVFSPPPYLPAR